MLERFDTVLAFVTVMLGVSLMIMVLIQLVSGTLAYRGAYLRGGLKQLFLMLNPKLGDKADRLATDVLTHPVLSDSIFANLPYMPVRWRLAKALRRDELIRILTDLATKDTSGEEHILEMLNQVDPDLVRRATVLVQTFKEVAPAASAETAERVASALTQAAASAGKLEAWFESTMDRVSQRFAMQTRVWTVIFAVLVAVGGHLDAIRLYRQLSTSPQARSALIGVSQSLLTQGLPSTDSQDLFRAKLQELTAKDPAMKSTPVPQGVGSRSDAIAWLRQNAPVGADVNGSIAAYNRSVDEALQADANAKLARIQSLNASLKDAGFQLVPVPYPGFHFGDDNVWGILAAAAFLSMGAPFWFNALRSMSNLRPTLAQAVEDKPVVTRS
jgi:hypothetical protein